MVQLIMIILSLTALTLLIDSRCIPNGAHTNHCRANLAHATKTLMYVYITIIVYAQH